MSEDVIVDSRIQTYIHWGPYEIEVADGRIVAVHGDANDPDPSPIGQSLRDAVDHRSRLGVRGELGGHLT